MGYFSMSSHHLRLFQLALVCAMAFTSTGCVRKLYRASHVEVFATDVQEVVVGNKGAVAYKCALMVQEGENEPEPRGTRYIVATPEAMKWLVNLHTVTPGQVDMAPQVVVITKDIGPNWRMLPTGLGEKTAEPADLPKDLFEKGTRYKPRAKDQPIEFPYKSGTTQMNVVTGDDMMFELRPLARQKWWYKQLILPAFAVDVVTYPFRWIF